MFSINISAFYSEFDLIDDIKDFILESLDSNTVISIIDDTLITLQTAGIIGTITIGRCNICINIFDIEMFEVINKCLSGIHDIVGSNEGVTIQILSDDYDSVNALINRFEGDLKDKYTIKTKLWRTGMVDIDIIIVSF